METITITPIKLIEPTPVIRGPKGLNGETIRGPKGDPGKDGKDGESIRGPKGDPGKDGKDGESIRGPKGDPGKDGKDGESIRGPKGLKGDRGLRGYKGLKGNDGKDFSVREVTEQDLAFLQDNLIGKLVKDIQINDDTEKTTITVSYTVGKPRILEVSKPKAKPKIIRVGGSVTNIDNSVTEEVLSPEDSANLALIADNSTESKINAKEQLLRIEKELKYIKTHLHIVTDEKITESDIGRDEQ